MRSICVITIAVICEYCFIKIRKEREMAKSDYAKYFRDPVSNSPSPHPEVTAPRLGLKSNKEFGNKQFSMTWWAITEPFVMVTDNHKHNFDQFLIFVGGDLNNMTDLGGEVEITLSEDGKKLQKFVLTKATQIFVPAGLYHCPLNFKKINDPKKPILFHDMFFGTEYKRV
jgi:hypothetical protein